MVLEGTKRESDGILAAVLEAGKQILDVYGDEITVSTKSDGSPVTTADEAAEAVILELLGREFPKVPVVSEEAVEAGHLPVARRHYFLVDPLDGTKEFIKRNGEFTVNVALVEEGVPVFGVVYAPALGEIYWGGAMTAEEPTQAFFGKVAGGKVTDVRPIQVRVPPLEGLSVLASRSHLSEETAEMIDRLNVVERLSVGSSLKLCWIAAGKADIYPRLSPTMQWDIAAGHAVIRAAGGHVLKAGDLNEMLYEMPRKPVKQDLLNPHFVAVSDLEVLRPLAQVSAG